MIPLPMSPTTFLNEVVAPALAAIGVTAMDSPEARLMLTAIALQESGLRTRTQDDGGPARGLLMFERNGVLSVMHGVATSSYAYNACIKFGVLWGSTSILAALQRDDELACVFARLLLWSDPRPLPELGDEMGAWNLYERCWRPGKPSYTRWKQVYPQALAAIQDQAGIAQ